MVVRLMPLPPLKQLIHRLWRKLSKHRRCQFMLIAVLMVLGAFVDVISLGAVFPFISALSAPETVFSMQMVQGIAGSLGITRADQLVLPLTMIFICATLLGCAFRLLVL